MNKDTPQQPVPKEVQLTPEELGGLVELEGKVEASFTHPVTGKKEIIKIDFEKSLEKWMNFYEKHGIRVPEKFPEVMRDIWERNEMKIKADIETYGFNHALFIPSTGDLVGLEKSMTEGYERETLQFARIADIKEIYLPRIVILHDVGNLAETPFFEQPKNNPQNIKQDFKNGLTLADWLIWQREYFEKTGVHPDNFTENYGTWLTGACVRGGAMVFVCWNGMLKEVTVSQYKEDSAYPDIGHRLSSRFT